MSFRRKPAAVVDFLNGLHADHLVLELAHRPDADLDALKEINDHIDIGIGVAESGSYMAHPKITGLFIPLLG